MKMYCPVDGEVIDVKPRKGTLSYDPAEMVCRSHGRPLETGMQRNARKSRGTGLRKDAEPQPIAEAPIIGVPLCRQAHGEVEDRNDFIYWEELDDELIQFCRKVDREYPDRQSMLARLEDESPRKAKGAAAAALNGRSTA